MPSTTKTTTGTAKIAKKPVKKQTTKIEAEAKAKPKKVTKKTEASDAPKKNTQIKTAKVSKTIISSEERHQMISEAAYYLAEKRGFQGGSPESDWFQASAEIDNMIING